MSYLDTDTEARVWLMDNCEKLPEEFKDTLPDVHVWLANQSLAYGGSEEGGWWFTVTAPVEDGKSELMRLDLAREFCRAENQKIEDNLPENHRPMSDTNSSGENRWVWTFDEPCCYPKQKPRYE
jgi:hypothetical protein